MIYLLNSKENYIPLVNYLQILAKIFTDKNLENKIVTQLPDVNTWDLAIIFTPYITEELVRSIQGKIILINTESLFVESCHKVWLEHIRKMIDSNNIYMVWDYNYKNIKKLNHYKGIKTYYIPPLYHYYLEEDYHKYENQNHQNLKKDTDILFYGSINERRAYLQEKLNKLDNVKVSFANTMNLEQHYHNISRSKIVLVIHYYLENFTIDYYRISSLLANKIFVIHESVQPEEKDSKEYALLSESLVFCDYDKIVETCEKYLKFSEEERDAICDEIYHIFKREMSLEQYLPFEQLSPRD